MTVYDLWQFMSYHKYVLYYDNIWLIINMILYYDNLWHINILWQFVTLPIYNDKRLLCYVYNIMKI